MKELNFTDNKLFSNEKIENIKNDLFIALEIFPHTDLFQDNIVEYIS